MPKSVLSLPVPRRVLVLASLLLPLLAGCAGRSTPIAKVGDEFVTEDQFKDAARGNEAQYVGSPDSAKTALLQDIVKRTILVQEAKRRHLLPDSTLERMRKQEAERLAVETLMQRLIPRDIAVSDAEVAEMYKRRAVQGHIFVAFVTSKAEADRAKAELEKGEDFAAVANRHNIPGMLPPGGDLGFLPPGALIEPLDSYLFDAPLNKVMGPDEIKGQGFVVAKVVERKPREQEPLGAQKASLKAMIKQRKQRSLQQDAFVALEKQYHVKLENGAGQALFELFNANKGAKPPAPVDSSRVLARYDGEGSRTATYSVRDALGDLTDPAQQRPNGSNEAQIERWIELQVVRKTTALEAKRRHLAQDPEVARRAEQRVNNALLEQLYGSQIASNVGTPSPEEIHEAYVRRASAFQRLESAKVRVLSIPDSAAAMKLLESVGHVPGGIAALVVKLPPGTRKTIGERELKFPSKDPQWQNLQAMFMGMSPGDVRGPLKQGGAWAVFELISKQQGTEAYEKLPPPLQQALQQEALEMKRDLRLVAYTDSLRNTVKIEIFRDKLKRVPWPVTPAEGGSS